MSGYGIVLRCVFCTREQRIDLSGLQYTRGMADHMLYMMTGGHRGHVPIGLPEWNVVGTESALGKSACCDAQTEGELWGYSEARDG